MGKKNSNRNGGKNTPQKRSTYSKNTGKKNEFQSKGFNQRRDHAYRMQSLENQASKSARDHDYRMKKLDAKVAGAAGKRKAVATAGRQATTATVAANLDEIVGALPHGDNLNETNDLATMGNADNKIQSEEGLGHGGISNVWW